MLDIAVSETMPELRPPVDAHLLVEEVKKAHEKYSAQISDKYNKIGKKNSNHMPSIRIVGWATSAHNRLQLVVDVEDGKNRFVFDASQFYNIKHGAQSMWQSIWMRYNVK